MPTNRNPDRLASGDGPALRVACWVLTGSVAALAGCAAVAPVGEPTGERRVQFACDNGQAIEMRFFPLQGVGVLVRDGQTMELQQRPAASGFHYSNGPNTVRGKGDDLMLEIGRMRPIACRAR